MDKSVTVHLLFEFLHQDILIREVKFLVIVFRRRKPGVGLDLCLYCDLQCRCYPLL